jgi:CPA2 family monovalent cation:H+ antiporter-2
MHAERLYGLGVTDAVPETIEASLQLAENTLIDLGIPMGLVLGSIHERRDRFRKAFGVRDPNHPLREKRLTSRHKVMPTKPQEAPNHQS